MTDDVFQAIGEVSVALPLELARRHRSDRTADVFHVQTRGDAPGLPGGSICIVSGLARSGLVRDVRAAAESGDAAAVAKVLEANERELRRRAHGDAKHRRHATVTEAIAAIPAITQVSYRGKLVAEGMPAFEEFPAVRVLVPYAGGELDPEAFAAHTYRLGKHRGVEVETVVIVRDPELSALEKKVLERLPREVNQLALGRGDLVANLGLAAAALVFVAVVVGGVLLAEYAQRQMQQERERQEREMERQIAGDQGQQQDQGVQQADQAPAQQADQGQQQQQQDQGQQQQQQDQGQQDQGQQDQGQQDQGQQDQGQGDQGQGDDHNNGGRLGRWLDLEKLAVELETLDTASAVTELVELRTSLMQAGQIR
jgi:hypothetical protein